MSFLGGIFGGNTAGADAANSATNQLYSAEAQGNAALTSGANTAKGEYSTDYYDPYTTAGNSATTMYSNALGLNGAAGNTAATSAFQAGPGYNFALQQGTDALNRSAASRGMLASGNNTEDLTNYAQGQANQAYNGWLSNLSGVSAQGLTAAGGQTGIENSKAGIDTGLGQGISANDMGAATSSANAEVQGATADAASNAQAGKNIFSAVLGGGNLAAKGLNL